MHVVVTGSEGYIGSALVRELEQFGYTVGKADIRSESGAIDICDKVDREYIADAKPDVVYNLAGISGEAAARRGTERAREVNFRAACALRAAVPNAVFVQASTASCIPLDTLVELPEDMPYAVSKYLAECALPQHGLGPLYVFRFATVFGANGDKTRWDLPIHRMVADAVETGTVTVRGPGLLRPWVSLRRLVRQLTHVAFDAKAGLARGYAYPMPACSFNATLGEMAQRVADSTGAKVKEDSEITDGRDYGMPALVEPTWIHREIERLAALKGGTVEIPTL